MNTRDPSPEQLDILRAKLKRLIWQTAAFDKRKRWVSLDRLWYYPDHRALYVSILTNYLRHLFGEKLNDYVLLCCDTITSEIGILPAAAIAAYSIGCRIAVWKELGSIIFGESRIYFDTVRREQCVVLQDVVRHGATILKISQELDEQYWSMISYVTLVKNCEDSSLLEKTLQRASTQSSTAPEFAFHYLIDASHL